MPDEQVEDGDVDVQVEGRVAHLVLSRPHRRNALSVPMVDRFLAALDAVEEDREVRVALLRGEGSAFCAGADFGDFEGGPDRGGFVPRFHALLDRIAALRVPVVAAVTGPAVGAGCQIVAQCDLRLAAASAVLGITGVRIGLMVDMENITRLVCEVGPATARRLLLTGELLTAEDARVAGLVHRVEPDDRALDAAVDWAAEVSDRAPLAVQGHKAAVQAVVHDWWLAEGSEEWQRNHGRALGVFGSNDLREGLAAFSERRPPDFHGA